jgi:hypothetical protein
VPKRSRLRTRAPSKPGTPHLRRPPPTWAQSLLEH